MGVFNSTINFAAISAAMATSTAAWMNGTVRIIDPNVGDSVWDVTTNTETGGEPTVLWQGPARIQHLVKDRLAEAGSNEAAIRGIRVQVPLDVDLGLIRTGLQVVVLDGGSDPVLEQLQFVVKSAVNSSFAWLRTIECDVDVKSVADSTWAGIAGTVLDVLAAPVADVIVRTFHLEGDLWISDYDTTTDVNGNYELPADVGVDVIVSVSKSGFVTQYYSNQPSAATADAVTPVNHVELQDIDFVILAA